MTPPRPNALPWLALSGAVIALDQASKALVLATLEPYVPHEVIPGLFNWTLAFNPGVAFSFLADQPGWQRWPLVLLALGMSAMLSRWLAHTRRGDWRTALPLALMIGGALGNMIDRVLSGVVTDFVQVYWRDWVFPSFNVADSAITVGVALLVAFGVFASGRKAAQS